MASTTVALAQPALRKQRSFHNYAPSAKRVKEQQKPQDDNPESVADLLRRLQESEQEKAELKRRAQKSTLTECLTASHELLYSTLPQIIEKDLSNCTTAKGHTKVDGKAVPPRLQIWTDFLDRQDAIFEQLEGLGDERIFSSKNSISGNGETLQSLRISNEDSTGLFITMALECPTKLMIDELNKIDTFRDQLNVPDGILFRKDLNGVDTPAGRSGNELSDQYCCHATNREGQIIFVAEYKPPHKLNPASFDFLKPGLNIFRTICQRKFVPEPEKEAFRKDVDMAAAIVQTFKDMIKQGLHYSMLTTGETIVFFWFDMEKDRRNLFYHISSFGEDAKPPESYRRTAQSQFLAFTLMAARGNPDERLTSNRDDIDNLTQSLEEWQEPVLQKEPGEEARADGQSQDEQLGSSQPSSQGSTAGSSYQPSELLSSPNTGERRTLRPRVQPLACSGEASDDINDSQDRDSDDEDDEQPSPGIPPRPSFGGREGGRQTGNSANGESVNGGSHGGAGAANDGTNEQHRSHCTQECLLGLVNGGPLDVKCPNVALHRGAGCSVVSSHPIDHKTFLQLLQKQLKRTLVQGIHRAGRNESGATGILFKATLLEYGYTMVFKGVQENARGALEHEIAVYERLQPIQGKHVPVCLGMIDLRTIGRTFHHSNAYDGYSEIILLLFLSWGGVNLFDAEVRLEAKQELEEKAKRSFRAVHELGVIQDDVRLENMLVNDDINGVMVIDFEHSKLLKRPRIPLLAKQARQKRVRPEEPELTSHKRSRKSQSAKAKTAARPRGANAGLFSEELSWLKCEFMGLSSRNRHLAQAKVA
ncbi:hypothetical protein CP532_0120 [Ophiocordyceps camponoti-leonardi (nom. inval.)]|nr:hypothetical protein CP532_0120 [Ophiocordyceps camponoti-leonardi (nom. inval.)]